MALKLQFHLFQKIWLRHLLWKKNIFRARIIKRIYSLFKKSILNLNSIVMNKNLFTYKKSGVNINAADKFVNFIANISSKKKAIKS